MTMHTEHVGQVTMALIAQVMRVQARKRGPSMSERNVTTIITRPLWVAWCVELGDPPDTEPTEWIGIHKTKRVYGSRTIVVESDLLASISY